MSKIISKNPLQDVVLVVWFFSAIGMLEIGFIHFWVAITNLLFVLMARNVIQAKRPLEIDKKFQPRTDPNAESYGFPSVESHMAVVVMFHLSWYFGSILFLLLALMVIFVVGVSRLYSRSRFPHQIVGSWITGFIGLIVSTHCCRSMDLHVMDKKHHYAVLITVGLIFAGFMALAIENNDSRVIYIPKKEFLAVISGIINGSNEANNRRETSAAIDLDGDFTGKLSKRNNLRATSSSQSNILSPSPRTMTADLLRMGINVRGNNSNVGSKYEPVRSKREKRDSFYFLQKSMEEREEIYRQIAAGDSKLKSKLYKVKQNYLYGHVNSVGAAWGMEMSWEREKREYGNEKSHVKARKRRLIDAMRTARSNVSDEDKGGLSTDYYSGSEGSSVGASSPRSRTDDEFAFNT